jgi:hypothetical protein
LRDVVRSSFTIVLFYFNWASTGLRFLLPLRTNGADYRSQRIVLINSLACQARRRYSSRTWSFGNVQGAPLVQLITADFLDFTLIGVVIVAIAIGILIIRINKQ